MKKICSDTAPLNKREWSVSKCFQRGLKSGFVAGLKKGRKEGIRRGRLNVEIEGRQPRPQGDIYDIIDEFVRGTQLINRPPVAVNFGVMPQDEVQVEPVQVAPPMQIPQAPVGMVFQPIEEEPVPAPLPRQPKLGRREKFKEFRERQKMGMEDVNVTKKPEPKAPINRKINASVLKKVLGKNYKTFITRIREESKTKPQETYDKMGIKELKTLANIMTENLQLSDENRGILTNVINDKKVQGNKSLIKTLMDSVINSLYQQGTGMRQSRVTYDPADARAMMNFLEGRLNYYTILYERSRSERHRKEIKDIEKQIERLRRQISTSIA
jgi:hypothetical protein